MKGSPHWVPSMLALSVNAGWKSSIVEDDTMSFAG